MKPTVLLFILFLSFEFIYSEPTNNQKKNLTSLKESKIFKSGIEVLQDKKIKTILPFETGFRKDLYDSDGNLLQSEYYNIEGEMVESAPKIAFEKRSYNSFGFLEKIQTIDKNKNLSSSLLFTYDKNCLQIKKEESCVTEISFTDGADNPIENEEGIFKYKTEFDPPCLQIEKRKPSDCKKLEVRLNKKLKLVGDIDGNAKIYRTFDSLGNLILYEIYDRSDTIIHKVIYAYDYKCIELTNKPQGCITLQQYSNRIEKKKTKSNIETTNYGKKILTYDLHCIQKKQNSEKCISLEENYDLKGNLQDITHRFTFGCMDYSIELGTYAKKISSFDDNGNEKLREFYNSKNQLIEDSSGGAKYVYAYNQKCLDNGHKTQYCNT
jgi:hypothetical protein